MKKIVILIVLLFIIVGCVPNSTQIKKINSKEELVKFISNLSSGKTYHEHILSGFANSWGEKNSYYSDSQTYGYDFLTGLYFFNDNGKTSYMGSQMAIYEEQSEQPFGDMMSKEEVLNGNIDPSVNLIVEQNENNSRMKVRFDELIGDYVKILNGLGGEYKIEHGDNYVELFMESADSHYLVSNMKIFSVIDIRFRYEKIDSGYKIEYSHVEHVNGSNIYKYNSTKIEVDIPRDVTMPKTNEDVKNLMYSTPKESLDNITNKYMN